jgi:hypothetical protein
MPTSEPIGKMPAIPNTGTAIVKAPTFDEVERALIKCNGLITYAAAELNCPIELVKKTIQRYKILRILVDQLRDGMIDAAEDTIMYRITEKRDSIAAMFLLKTIGKGRGWIEKEDRKAGDTADKPVYIKILPIGMDNGEYTEDGRKKGGNKKLKTAKAVSATIPALKANNVPLTKEEQEFVDAEIID